MGASRISFDGSATHATIIGHVTPTHGRESKRMAIDLGAVIGKGAAPEPEAQQQAQPKATETEPKGGAQEAQSGQSPGPASTAETKSGEATTDEKPPGKWAPVSALIDERRKRQRLEDELAELRRQVGDRATAPAPETRAFTEQEQADWDDSVLADLPSAFRKVETKLAGRLESQRYSQSEAFARHILPDYDAVVSEYKDMIREAPHVVRTVHEAPAPALAAYQAVKAWKEAKEADPKAIEARVRAEAQTKMQELEAKVRELEARAAIASAPTSLGTTRGAGAATSASTVPAWSGPPPLDSVIRRR